MQLTNPIWLWGLTGLLIPIAIHLLSRKEGKVIKFGSLRHLEESQSKQSINIRLNEIVLLLLRCGLISLIVVVLCGIDGVFQSGKNKWIVIEEGLNNNDDILRLTDSLSREGFDIRSMSEGFPATFDTHAEPFANYWEMVAQLPLGSLDQVIILSNSYSSKFKGKRIALPANVTWITREPDAKDFILTATRFSNDSVIVRAGKSTPSLTEFTNITERIDILSQSGDKVVEPDTVRIAIHSDPGFYYDRKIILASLNAIERSIPVIFKTTNTDSGNDKSTEEADWTIWLSDKDPAIKNGNLIAMEDQSINDHPLLKNIINEEGQRWIITKRLNEEIALKNQLALNLSYLLTKSQIAESRADSLDRTTQPEELFTGGNSNTPGAFLRMADDQGEQVLLITILLLLTVERILSLRRNA